MSQARCNSLLIVLLAAACGLSFAVEKQAPRKNSTQAPAAPAVDKPSATPAAGKPSTAPSPGKPEILDKSTVFGDRELPNVMYIVPWKRPEMGDLVTKPVKSLLDESIAPLDRDVFQREIRFYEELHSE